MTIKAMKQALEALENIDGAMPFPVGRSAITALRTAIAEAEHSEQNLDMVEATVKKHLPVEQEPVGEVVNDRGEVDYFSYLPERGTKLYTTPPAAPVQPITPKKIDVLTRIEKSIRYSPNFVSGWNAAIDSMLATPPAAQHEPVAPIEASADNDCAYAYADGWNACLRKLYTTPPAAQQGMTIDASAPIVMTPHPAFAHRSAAQRPPVQVSPLDFVEMVTDKEHLIGNPIVWTEWPNKEKNT